MQTKRRTIYRIYHKLHIEERQRFIRFLNAIEPQDELRQIASLMLVDDLTDFEVWEKLFSDKAYDDSYFRRQIEKLMVQLEDFLAWRALQENAPLKKAFFIRGLATQNILKEEGFDTRFRKALRQVKALPLQNVDRLEAESLILKYGMQMQMLPELKEATIAKRSPALLDEKAMIVKILYHFCIKQVYEQIGEKDSYLINLFPIEIWLAQLEKVSELMADPLISFLWHLARFIHLKEGKASFLVDELIEVKHLMRDDEFKNLFLVLQTQLVIAVNHENKVELYPVLLQLVEESIEKRLFFVNGYLNISHYNNFTQLHYLNLIKQAPTTLAEEQKSHILAFLKRYKRHLPPEYAHSIYHMNRDRILFVFGEYDKINENLRAWDFPTATMAVNYQLTVCKALYERKAYPDVIRRFKSLKAYLGDHKTISPKAKRIYENQIRWLRKICQLRELRIAKSERRRRAQHLLEQIKNHASSTDKAWLISKIQAYQTELA